MSLPSNVRPAFMRPSHVERRRKPATAFARALAYTVLACFIAVVTAVIALANVLH